MMSDSGIITELTRDECDELNACACPLRVSTTEGARRVESRIRQLFPERYQKRYLYHFSKPEVIGKWLNDPAADLRCTYYQHLNDCLEWHNGIEYVCEHLLKSGNNELADAVEELPQKKGCGPWIGCFSENDDTAAMWGMYGDRKIGGYAVGFEREVLMQLVEAKNNALKVKQELANDEYWLLPCIYRGDPRIDKIIDYILYEKYTDVDEHLLREGCGDEILDRQLSRLFFLTLIIKDSSFDYEKEWRMITRRGCVGPMLELDSEVSWSGCAYVNSEIFDRPLREQIARIVVSPCGSGGGFIDYATLNFTTACRLKEMYHLGFEINKSQSSYRGL